MQKQEQPKEYQEGYDAYCLTYGSSECPYEVGTPESKAWHNGYIDASYDILSACIPEKYNGPD
jgi:hypothetical protein